MAHVCPWWLGYFLINPLRRWRQDPKQILSPYVRAGMTVLEPGPGMGFFTLELARLVGASGRVIAVDIQPRMLEKLRHRAARQALVDRIEIRLATPNSLRVDDLYGTVDFVLAFAVVHELPAVRPFFEEVARSLKSGASLLLVEPRGHVKIKQFEEELQSAASAGLLAIGRSTIRASHAALLQKQ